MDAVGILSLTYSRVTSTSPVMWSRGLVKRRL